MFIFMTVMTHDNKLQDNSR